MKSINFGEKNYRFLIFYILLLFYYLFIPFFLIKTGHFFNIVKDSIAYIDIASAYQNTLRIINIELLFLFITIISFFLYLFIKTLCNTSNQDKNIKNISLFFYIILTTCSLILLVDISLLIYKLFLKEILFTRDSIYVHFLHNKRTTHIIIGSIIAVYLFIEKKNKLSILFFLLLILFTILTFSRFELLLFLISYFLFIDKNKIKYFLSIFIIFILYRIIFNAFINKTTLTSIIMTILWEPSSIWLNAINTYANYLYFFEQENYLYQIFLNNFSINALSNNRYEQIFFKKNIFLYPVSTARLGFLEFIGYPITLLILAIFALIQKKIISNFLNLKNLYYILSVYLAFFSLRGSLLNGFLFINKFLLLIMALILITKSYKLIKDKLNIKFF